MAIDITDRTSSLADRILRRLARMLVGMSGVDIEFALKEARQTARRENRDLNVADVEAALLRRKPAKSDEVRFYQSIHEAGHAVAQIHFRIGRIELITVNGTGGAAYVDPPVDFRRELASLELLTKLIVIDLAGRAAEELLSGRVSAGGRQAATRYAYDLEMNLGFGTYPLLYRNVADPFALLAVDSSLAERVNQRLENAYQVAREIVTRHQTAVKYLAAYLFEDETLEGNALETALTEVRKLMADSHANL
jgi:cell division protease FtsH